MRILPLLAGLLIPLGGCTPIDATLGGAVRQNVAVQVVNPQPAVTSGWDTSGDRAALAMKRYRTGTVIEPHGITTTSGIQGGANGGSGTGGTGGY